LKVKMCWIFFSSNSALFHCFTTYDTCCRFITVHIIISIISLQHR